MAFGSQFASISAVVAEYFAYAESSSTNAAASIRCVVQRACFLSHSSRKDSNSRVLWIAGPNGGPQINPATGQPDYSAQWVEYYKSIGMMKEAAVVEEQAKLNKASTPEFVFSNRHSCLTIVVIVRCN